MFLTNKKQIVLTNTNKLVMKIYLIFGLRLCVFDGTGVDHVAILTTDGAVLTLESVTAR